MNNKLKTLLVSTIIFGISNNICYSMNNNEQLDETEGNNQHNKNNFLIKLEQHIKEKNLPDKQQEIQQLDQKLHHKYCKIMETNNNISEYYCSLYSAIRQLEEDDNSTFFVFPNILVLMEIHNDYLLAYTKSYISDTNICNELMPNSDVKNQSNESSQDKILTLKHFGYYYTSEIYKQQINMYKKVLKSMNININNITSEQIPNIINEMSETEIKNKMKNTIQNVIEPALDDMEDLKNKIVPLVDNLSELQIYKGNKSYNELLQNMKTNLYMYSCKHEDLKSEVATFYYLLE